MYTSKEVYEYISLKTNDLIVERKTCRISGTEFPIYQSDLDFYTKISPTFDGQKFQIPTPTLCPEERQRRRLSFRNERKLYKRRCDATGEQIISIYSPDKPYTVYNAKYRWSDARDPMSYGRDFDFTSSFMEQFKTLRELVPAPGRTAEEPTLINSDYCNEAGHLKDCYLVFEGGLSEKSYYSRGIIRALWNVDCLNCDQCKNIYECVECINCNNSKRSDHCKDCDRVSHCSNCINCKDCLYCDNLVNHQYCIKNTQYTKTEYDTLLLTHVLKNSINNISIKNHNHNVMVENSYGEYLTNSKNMRFCYVCSECEDCRYCEFLLGGYPNKDSCDISNFGMGMNLCHECQCVGGNPGESYKLAFCNLCRPSTNLLYCHFCVSSRDCFGCIGLRNKSYCIFNKQYNKEEYEKTVAKIIAHMMTPNPTPHPNPLPTASLGEGAGYSERGEFFHPSLSPFGYNETVAQEYYQLHKPQTANNIPQKVGSIASVVGSPHGSMQFEVWSQYGYKWSDYSSDPKIPEGVATLQGDQVPSDITTVTDDICKKIILCEVSKRPFMIQKTELEFYRKHNISLPRKHPDIRHEERMKLRPGRTLFLRNCDCCGEKMLSVYPPVEKSHKEQQEVEKSSIYCEKCYQKEVYA